MRLFAVRHGATEYSRERRFAGSRDVPLTTDGRLQADAVAQALAGAGVAAVYTSPLERARVCAELIAKPHRLGTHVEPDFREMAFGGWEGITREELPARSARVIPPQPPKAISRKSGSTCVPRRWGLAISSAQT